MAEMTRSWWEKKRRETAADAMSRQAFRKSKTMDLLREFEQRHISAAAKNASVDQRIILADSSRFRSP